MLASCADWHSLKTVASGKSPNLLYAIELDQRFSRQIAERVLPSQFAALAF